MAQTIVFKKKHDILLKKFKAKTKFVKTLRENFAKQEKEFPGSVISLMRKFMILQKQTNIRTSTLLILGLTTKQCNEDYWRELHQNIIEIERRELV